MVLWWRRDDGLWNGMRLLGGMVKRVGLCGKVLHMGCVGVVLGPMTVLVRVRVRCGRHMWGTVAKVIGGCLEGVVLLRRGAVGGTWYRIPVIRILMPSHLFTRICDLSRLANILSIGLNVSRIPWILLVAILRIRCIPIA